jgi:glycosyltransferase involved in cell wall biosynthesis
MKVAFLIPGSGDIFYCENCVRDYSFTQALEKQGIDLFQIPLYLPLLSSPASQKPSPVFYGAISLYLTHKLPLLKRLPAWCKKILDSRPLLSLAARLSAATRAGDLDALTISMLKGERGGQKEELENLIRYIKHNIKPDLVHISNALLLGVSRRIKTEINIPVVCSLQDEHTWIKMMRPLYAKKAWALLKDNAQYVDRFIAVSHYYKKVMTEKLAVHASNIHVVYNGVHSALYKQGNIKTPSPILGFLSRICKTTGFDTLVSAFIALKRRPHLRDLRLHATGGYNHDDKPFLRRIMRKLKKLKFDKDVKIISPFLQERRFDFLSSLSVLSVPLPFPEAFGMFIIESLASGVPVVVPKNGAFSEIMEATKGGLTYDPARFNELVQRLDTLLSHPAYAGDMGRSGRKHVVKYFSLDAMAGNMVKVYEKCLSRY